MRRGGHRQKPSRSRKLGWKWSLATDAVGIPIGWVAAAANRNDSVLLPATLEAADDQGLLEEISTLHLDRGYDNGVVRAHVAELGIAEVVVPKVRPKEGTAVEPRLGSRSGAAGRSSAPTRGSATTASSGATPTASSDIALPSSPS